MVHRFESVIINASPPFQFAWYTRRVGLAGIYKMTELYMLQDKSEDLKATFTFLERRMEEAVMLNKVMESSDGVSANVQKAIGTAFETVSWRIRWIEQNRVTPSLPIAG